MSLEIEEDLVLKGVGKHYGDLCVLEATNLHVRTGEFLTIVGPSGSGKTTLLRMIAGFTEATQGTISFHGQDILQVPTHRRPFNTVFQDYALFPHMTVTENVGYGPMLRREPRNQIASKVVSALTTVGLQTLGDRMPSQLSGGQKQRVALARALVCDPKVLLLDEPLSALDAEMRHQMQVFLKDLQRRVKTTFILVTHDQEEAITMSDRIAVMSAGKLEQIGTHQEVYYAPKTRFVANFFGDNNLVEANVLPNGVVECPFGRFAGSDPQARGPVALAIRPEAIGINGGEAPDQFVIPAQIAQVNFAGPLTRVLAAPTAHPELALMIKLTSGQANALEPGETVQLRVSTRDIAVVAEPAPKLARAS